MLELIVGIAAITIPPIIIGAIHFRNNPPLLMFMIVLLVVANGYLVSTGTATDIGRSILYGKDAPKVEAPASIPGAQPAR